jgi:hypothetical protein
VSGVAEGPDSAWVSTPALLHCTEGTTEARVEWAYFADAPFTIHVLLAVDPDTTVSVVFARDLLLCGLRTRVGLGDVQLGPGLGNARHGSLWLQLRALRGVVVLEVPREPVATFAVATYDVVAPGFESCHLGLDAELRSLLA